MYPSYPSCSQNARNRTKQTWHYKITFRLEQRLNLTNAIHRWKSPLYNLTLISKERFFYLVWGYNFYQKIWKTSTKKSESVVSCFALNYLNLVCPQCMDSQEHTQTEDFPKSHRHHFQLPRITTLMRNEGEKSFIPTFHHMLLRSSGLNSFQGFIRFRKKPRDYPEHTLRRHLNSLNHCLETARA